MVSISLSFFSLVQLLMSRSRATAAAAFGVQS